MAKPPLLAGAVNVTLAVDDPVAVADALVGAPGNVQVVILLLAPLALPVPTLLVALTVKV
jgi:hypothetical protein